MIVGHYAAALLPRSALHDQPFWILLVAANVPEFAWLLFAAIGVEPTAPASILDATVSNIQVDMIYSHNLVPGIVQGVLVAAAVLAWRRHRRLALWCGALTVIHVLCDYVVGYQHQVLGLHSHPIGLNTYVRAPYVALAIELAFSLAAVAWFVRTERLRGAPVPAARVRALVIVFVVGVAMWIPTVRTPLRALLSL